MEAMGTDCRITSSWDIQVEFSGPIFVIFWMKEEVDNNHHSVPFFDPDDPDFSKDPDAKRMVAEGQRECEQSMREDESDEEDE